MNIRTLFYFSFFIPLFFYLNSCKTKEEAKLKPVQPQTYTNPILTGFYPDPSICNDGKGNYYLVNSTFAYYPGIPIFHSTDLVNWNQIGHVLNRPEQLDLEGYRVTRAIFAPAISYNKGTFYLTCTLVDGKGNFVVTAKNPEGPWSNPKWLPEIKGIDPSLFFDDNGKSYIVYNSDAPDNKPEYDGHRTIRVNEFDKDSLKVISENRILVNGGVNFSEKPIWAEGPHIYKINDYYYLMTAEGGTAVNHTEVIYRTHHLDSTFVPYENNPILTQKHLDPTRKNPVTSAGHADLIQTKEGEWYGVFLACRPYEGDFYNTGRETFLAPVKWENNWPVFDLDGEEIKYKYPLPKNTKIDTTLFPLNNNFGFKENFEEPELKFHWTFLRTVKTPWYNLHEKQGYLTIKTRPETVSGTSNPSFIAHRQQHLKGNVSTEFIFEPKKENEKAGLIIFQNETHYYYLCKSLKNNIPVVQLYQSNGKDMELLATKELKAGLPELALRIEADFSKYHFYYKENKQWISLKKDIDAKFLSTHIAGGFVGAVYAMYTTSLGEPGHNQASYNWFEYTGHDPVYTE
ncbi:glycoside hydrolase family 43 protein [Abyssalbus ytuae]|uniref:Glycoside hydrolase family 43 protein n=1 Tax=Abyssalbus ytuae TaxID=2926907 RepID=A0A9E6ZJV9_9FLAO|nr:glycoside hydrolase family 43 protein [Abyssalbus ytuae]UOB16964.1 glycoside hydrolase family 43 protein [Abyssalbus ytuae]